MNFNTESNTTDITPFIFQLENPQVYTGREINAIKKDPSFIKDPIYICLVFPDKYEIGMSHYGLILLYHFLNNIENVIAERCFLPGKASIELFKQYQVPLFSLESRRPLKEFDIIAISFMSEMNATNIFPVLELAQIPLRTNQRASAPPFPIITLGGVATVNPEPLREFIDVFGIGDGEALFPDIISAVSTAKTLKSDRQTLFNQLDKIQGIYVPSLYPLVSRGRIFTPDIKPGKIKKRIAKNLAGLISQDAIIAPLTNVVFNRFNVEIARGCPQNCRFCQAKSYYSPYRTRPVHENLYHLFKGLKETGFETFSLSTLSTGDYPQLQQIIDIIPQILEVRPGVNFSLSSLRPSTLSQDMLSTIAMYKRTGITIVPEAGTQRLRNVINKAVTDEEIFQAVDLALKNRWQKIKLYFMLGLPTETIEDIQGIIRMIYTMMDMSRAAKQRIKINASFSPFVPKPQTPLQWARGENREHIYEAIRLIKNEFRTPLKQGILEFDFHLVDTSIVEMLIARGDYRVGELLLAAYQKGEIFSAWDSEFHFPVWAQMITGTPLEIFLHEFSVDEPLPWDYLQVNHTTSYLKEEYQKALSAEPTTPCSQHQCPQCGGCLYPIVHHSSSHQEPLPQSNHQSNDPLQQLKEEINQLKQSAPAPSQYQPIRVVYEKTGDFIFFSHLAMMQYIERLIRKTGIFFKCTEGFTPRLKMQSLPALPVFATGLNEVVEFYVDSSLDQQTITRLLDEAARPQQFQFKQVILSSQNPLLSRHIRFIQYQIKGENLQQYAQSFAQHLLPTDSISYYPDYIRISLDYPKQGQERFAKIYKIIDPEKKNTISLTRLGVIFAGQDTQPQKSGESDEQL